MSAGQDAMGAHQLPPPRGPATRVVINGRFLGQPLTGVQRFGREMLLALDEVLPRHPAGQGLRWQLALPAGTPGLALQHLETVSVGHRQGHAWEQLDLARHAADAALLIGLGFTGPLMLRHQFITVHDGAVVRHPQAYRLGFRLGYRGLVGWLGRRVQAVLAVSDFSAQEAQACFGVDAARIARVSEGWQHLDRIPADPRVLDRHGLRGQPFALAVGSPQVNKNFGLIPRALALLGAAAPRCVAVGAPDPRVFQAGSLPPDAVQALGRVDDAELKALYQAASCFVFPSRYEGFGIPPLEAMACGCPVIVSTIAPLRELCGAEAALYTDPERPEELAAQLQRVCGDAALRGRLRQAGLARAARFSWAGSATRLLDHVQAALQPRPEARTVDGHA